ncbi:MAG: SPOR domain-containing protein [Gammaproteobacteria bacterium]|nr:SPOR domain-containing protein [Gammaproteobacteria bacterium]
MLGGLAIGLFVAFLVYLNNNIHAGKKTNLVSAFKETLQHDARDVRKDTPKPPPPPPAQPAAKPAEKPKPNFDFYTILPELEVAVPEQEIAAKSQKPAAQQDDKSEYILQAGSFRDYKQADQLKAKLALQGIDANIQSVQVNQDTWHRVRIGPIHKMATLTATLKRLKEQNIAVIIVKSKT